MSHMLTVKMFCYSHQTNIFVYLMMYIHYVFIYLFFGGAEC